MNSKVLLLGAMLAAGAAASAATPFEWEPQVFPDPQYDQTDINTVCDMTVYSRTDFEVKPSTEIMAMWVDEDGNEIHAVDGGEFWGSIFYSFDPAEFTHNGDYTLIFPEGMLTDADGTPSEAKEYYYTFAIPELEKGMFEDFTVESTTPDFTQPQSLWNNLQVTFNTNHNKDICYTTLQVFEYDPVYEELGESVLLSANHTSLHELGDNSPITWEVYGSYTFYNNKTYRMVVTFFNGPERLEDGSLSKVVDHYTVDFKGKVEPYKYSDIEMVEFYPPLDYVFNTIDDLKFTFTFSGPVNITKGDLASGTNGDHIFNPEWFTSNDDKTVWSLDLTQDSFFQSGSHSSFTMNIHAKDLDGNVLEGDSGYGDQACYQIGYNYSNIGKPTLSVTPEQGAILDELTSVTITADNGKAMTRSWLGKIEIQTKQRALIGTLWQSDEDIDMGKSYTFTKWIPNGAKDPEPINLVKAGVYTIVVPADYVNWGEQYETEGNRNVAVGITITGAKDDAPKVTADFIPVSTTPANYSEVTSLKNVTLTFDEVVCLASWNASVMDEKGVEVTSADLDYPADFSNVNDIVVRLADEITTAGTYFVIIPEGAIGDNAYDQSMGQQGRCNPMLTYEFIVKGNGGETPGEGIQILSIDPENGSTVKELDKIMIYTNCEEVDVANSMAYVYVFTSDGKKVTWDYDGYPAPVWAILSFSWTAGNAFEINLDPAITEPGTYTFTIPGAWMADRNDYDNVINEDLTFTYTVSGQVSVDAVNAVEADVIYDLQGRAVKNPAAGVYVKNGKKVVVK